MSNVLRLSELSAASGPVFMRLCIMVLILLALASTPPSATAGDQRQPLRDHLTIYHRTSETDRVSQELRQALDLLPERIQNRLTAFGVKLVLAPTLLEAMPHLANEKPSWNVNAGYESCPALYSPSNKTLYIAERWKGFAANSITHNVLHECGHAYDHLKGNVSASDSFREAVQSDGDNLTNELRTKFRYKRADIAMNSRELYAEFFATACTPGIDKSPTIESRWYSDMSKAFPKSFEFVRKSIAN